MPTLAIWISGVQTAVSKYIAEYDAKQDVPGCGRCASAGLMIMLGAGVLGLLLTAVLAWQVPVIFHKMPDRLYGDVRLSILFVGSSLSVSLATSVFVAIFLGLQRYHVPMVITMVSRLLFGAVICLAVALHSSLAVMGAAAACVNLLTALLQIEAWRRRAQHIRVSLRLFDAGMLKKMINYCGVLSVWSVCMLFVGGLDLTIVGHYAFSETAYYAIAASPTSLILMVIAALMGPLLPATSALSVLRTPAQMGSLLLKNHSICHYDSFADRHAHHSDWIFSASAMGGDLSMRYIACCFFVFSLSRISSETCVRLMPLWSWQRTGSGSQLPLP